MLQKQLFNYWKKNLDAVGINSELKLLYLQYIQPLIKNNVPIIFDFNHLCLLLGRNSQYLSSVINANANHYRIFKMPKKRGGFREITAPFPALMECQQWIYNNILANISIHQAAQGFAFDKSIVTNSSAHLNQEQFLKIDLKDFFPSIKINRVIALFKKLGYSHKVSFYLASICCYGDALPQGAPTSPMISNIIAISLDNRLMGLANRFNLKYTRYADDLAFSGTNISYRILLYINNIINDFGFEINESKTILQKNKGKRILTGISIAEDKLKIPREYKRQLKQEIYFIKTYGISSHIRKMKIKNPHYLQSVIGRVMFWISVEPDSLHAKQALNYLKTLQY